MIPKTLLDSLLAQGYLTQPVYVDLLNRMRQQNTRRWLSMRLLAMGGAFVLAGLVCFFAANWQNVGVVWRLALPLAGLVGCGLGAYYKKLNTPAGQSFAFGIAVLIGVFLAVFGQIYQTGAFLYELFGLWALLLLPLCVLTRNKWLYLFTLYVATVYGWFLADYSLAFWVGLVAVYVPAWALVEFLPSCKNWGGGYKRFLWMLLSAYVTFTGVWEATNNMHFPEALYYLFALALAFGWTSYAWRAKKVDLFAWNTLALAALVSGYLAHVWRFNRLSWGVYCVLFMASGWATYYFWHRVKEGEK